MAKLAIPGSDYSFQHPNHAQYAALGFRFALRYFGPGSGAKMATATEIADLRARGVDIGTLVEGDAGDMLTGASTGRAHALAAVEHASRCGMPARRPYYFAADKDLNEITWRQCWPYLDAAAAVVGREWVGIYGELDVTRWAARDGKARWFFQTYAWSDEDGSGQVEPDEWFQGNHIEQYRNGQRVAGGVIDLCRGTKADYGQWGYQPTEVTMVRYRFDASWLDRPVDLGDRIVVTDHMGLYDVEPFSVPESGLPAVIVLSKSSVASGKWSFAQAFANVTGGCSYDSAQQHGVATWRQPASSGAGLTADEAAAIADARIAASSVVPAPATDA